MLPPDSFDSYQPARPGDVLTLEVEGLGDNGDGLCRIQNYVIFVPGALPGETVEVEIVNATRKHGRGRLQEIETASAGRVEPRCRHFAECGGCSLQHLEYAAQLRYKTETIRDLLKHTLDREDVPVLPCIGPDEPWGNRTRVALQVTEDHGHLAGGLFRKRSRDLIEIEECPVSDPHALAVAQAAIEAARGLGVEAWNPRTDFGTLRTALVRANAHGESELTLIVRRKDASEIAALRRGAFGARSVFLNINDGDRDRMVGRFTEHLQGERFFADEVAGKSLRLSPAAWLRTSRFALEKMAELVTQLVAPIEKAIVLDLYSGVGCFALAIADRVATVIGVEEHPRAVADAIANAESNRATNVSFRRSKVERFLQDEKQHVYAAILDPPPEGCGRFVINALAKVQRPERLIYVAQNPKTFAEETVILEDRGYRLTAVHPVDTCPHTATVELVALFESSMQGGKRRSSISQARRLLDRVRSEERTPQKPQEPPKI